MLPEVGQIVFFKDVVETTEDIRTVNRRAVITEVHNSSCVNLKIVDFVGRGIVAHVYRGKYGGAWDWIELNE